MRFISKQEWLIPARVCTPPIPIPQLKNTTKIQFRATIRLWIKTKLLVINLKKYFQIHGICFYWYKKEMEKKSEWIYINVVCIVSMSEVLIVPLWPADKESFSDLLQIWSHCLLKQKMSREKLNTNEMFVVFPTIGPFMMQWCHHQSPLFLFVSCNALEQQTLYDDGSDASLILLLPFFFENKATTFKQSSHFKTS